MLKLINLKTEYQQNPIGIEVKRPRFSWILQSDKQNVLQKSCRILVMEKEAETVVWDSGVLQTDQSVLMKYAGESLKPACEYAIHLTVTDNYGEQADAQAGFETGLFSGENFYGQWITDCLEESEVPPIFQKDFKLKGNIKKARIYASALGIYELRINGEKVGEEFFAPGWTSYHNRLQYQTYDVTGMLKSTNTVEMTVAPGWFKGILGFVDAQNHYGNTLAAIANIRLVYENGVVEMIGTDDSWRATTGETRYSEIYMGEVIDRTADPQPIGNVRLFDYPKSVLTAQENEPVRIVERRKPVEKILTPKGELVLDFGQNMTGLVECCLNQKKGQRIVIRHGEVLDKDGNFYTENLRSAKAEDTFICSGKQETLMPRFTFHGFRYICIEGIEEPWKPEDFTACVLHTDMEATGSLKFFFDESGMNSFNHYA